MHDEFLHRLRKDPPPEFAARLQTRLRRQSTLPREARAPSLLRTLITVLLLGGTAFAVTWVAMRGVPAPIVEWYRQAGGVIAGRHASSSAQTAGNGGIGSGLWWGASRSSPQPGAAPTGRPAHPAGAVASTPTSTSPSAVTSSSVVTGGALPGQGTQIRVVSSWSAYPYAEVFAAQINSATGADAGLLTHVDVSVTDSTHLLASVCRGGASDPDAAYAFAPAGSVSNRPCVGYAGPLDNRVVAIPVDYEAVALARSPVYGEIDLTRRELFLALAKWVPDPSRPGAIHENPNTTWRQIDPSLGPERIELMGPALSQPTGRSMITLLMQAGCDTYSWIAALKSTDPKRHARICRTVRTDGIYVEASYLNGAGLLGNPSAVGILAFRTLRLDPVKDLAVSRLDGIKPTLQSIESGAYPASSELYLYVNQRIDVKVMDRLALPESPWNLEWALIELPYPQRAAAFQSALGH